MKIVWRNFKFEISIATLVSKSGCLFKFSNSQSYLLFDNGALGHIICVIVEKVTQEVQGIKEINTQLAELTPCKYLLYQ